VVDALASARRELEHAVDRAEAELSRLRKALDALIELDGEPSKSSRRPRRPATSAAPKKRRRRGGTRADQALKLVQSNPGITVSELATSMGIAPNYLYRVMPTLEKEGKVKKDGRGWKAT